jgi:hypothetical protein
MIHPTYIIARRTTLKAYFQSLRHIKKQKQLFHFMLVFAAGISPAPLLVASAGTIFAL